MKNMLDCPICGMKPEVHETSAFSGAGAGYMLNCCDLIANGRNLHETRNRWNKAVMEYRKMVALEKLASVFQDGNINAEVRVDERSSVSGYLND